jgi:hypothetical protein
MRAMVHEDILNIIPAEGRLTKLAFQADEDWNTYPLSEYTCASCGEKVGFSLRDLDKHAYSDRTNLSEGDAAAFTAVAAKRLGEANSFLDFYCPGCKAPVRLYYHAWVGGRFTQGHVIKFVIEKVAR